MAVVRRLRRHADWPHLDDITVPALRVLREVALVAAEHTRRSEPAPAF